MTQDEQTRRKAQTIDNVAKYRNELACLIAQAVEYQDEIQRLLPFLRAITGKQEQPRMVYTTGGRIDLDDYMPEGNLPTTHNVRLLFQKIGETQRKLFQAQELLREWGVLPPSN